MLFMKYDLESAYISVNPSAVLGTASMKLVIKWKIAKQKVSLGAAGYIVDYVTSTNQNHQADVLAVDWENNIHGAVFGIAV